MNDEHTLEQLSKEDEIALTQELQAVLAKYDAEMGVSSHIEILKRVHNSIPSPITRDDIDNGEAGGKS